MRGPVAVLLLALSLACAVGPRHPYVLEPDFALPHDARLYLAPMNPNSPLANELIDGSERVHARIRSVLESHGISIVEDSYREFRPAWQRAFRGIEIPEAEEGESPALPHEGVEKLFRMLDASQRGFGWLLVPELVGRAARIGGHAVRWDGVRRQLEGAHGRSYGTGHVRAVSLRLRLFDDGGRLVFDSYGGLDLMFRLNWSEGRWEQFPELLAVEKHLNEGVAVAFHPLLVEPR